MQTLEHTEQFSAVFHIETGTVVAHAELVAAIGHRRVADLDFGHLALGAVLDRIAKQVHPQLAHHVFVGNQHRQWCDMPFHPVAGVLALHVGIQNRTRFGHQRLHVHRLQAQRTAAQARIHQQIVDQRGHAPRRAADHFHVMARLLVGRIAQMTRQLVGESGHMPQRCAQIVRDRIAEGFQLAVDFRDLLHLAFHLPVELMDTQLRGLLQADVAHRHQHHVFVGGVGQRHAACIDQHGAQHAVGGALLVFVIPQLASTQQHVRQTLVDLRIAPDAPAHILQRHQLVAALFQAIQVGEGRVMQHDALAGIQQHDRLAHGLQHRAGAAIGAQVFLLGRQPAADLPLQQPGHRAQQQQLHRQRCPAQHRVMHALGFGARIAQRQQTAFGALQVIDQHTDRVVQGHVVDQRADLLRRGGHRNALGQ
ncbi:hypothetical protein XAUC_28580 [Xanthomonas citri pv. aurantifolii str. ICPB 10535]|nr:hypothetical protein XAUC_28580 [Xanthomonas citri pv. aurantifolii str. ICPB 10535]